MDVVGRVGMIDFMKAHRGFFSPEKPFEHPVHVDNVVLWPPVDVNPLAELGDGVTVGRHTNICGAVSIGEGTRIQGFCFIPEGVTIEDHVFVGPNVTFTNMKYPQVRHEQHAFAKTYDKTLVKSGASIGAGSIIGPGVTIGKGALVAMGSVVTKDVMDGWLVKGNPARHIRELVND